MTTVVLDAWAWLAFLKNELEAPLVAQLLTDAEFAPLVAAEGLKVRWLRQI